MHEFQFYFLFEKKLCRNRRILNIDKCKGHENYLIIEQCEASGNIANAKGKFISTIDSIIVSHRC